MKQLNIMLSSVLFFFCLLINVSFAEWTNVPTTVFSTQSETVVSDTIAGYTLSQIRGFFKSDVSDRNTMLETVKDAGYYVLWVPYADDLSSYITLVFPISSNVDFGAKTDGLDTSNFYFYPYIDEGYVFYRKGLGGSSSTASKFSCTKTGIYSTYSSNSFTYSTFKTLISEDPLKFGNIPYLKQLTFNSGYYWDGTSYFFENSEPEDPETPTIPTNAEIASAVQMFYNSDLYKNNTNFKDFMVVYSFATGYYSFIGTDNHLLQEIYYDGAKPSNDDFTYPETWWRFYNYLGNIQNLFYGSNYWLYSTLKVDDVLSPIKYDGVGKLNNLFNLKFTNQSVIVYSSYEYEVYEYWPPEIEGDSNKQEITTIPGDQYTYDETLDPTDSEYSPIQNYIPVNPSQTIISDVDFDEINKTFEENKGILNIENASWLFTANNKLIGYFIGFLSLLIVFLIISRALGG